MLHPVKLPREIKGALYISDMPGFSDPLTRRIQQIETHGVTTVVCLTPMEEIRGKSPEYAKLIQSGKQSWRHVMFPIMDFGIPETKEKFLQLVLDVASGLKNGDAVLIHCAYGIGRTGMLATCVLAALGVSSKEVKHLLFNAGAADPESTPQKYFVQWVLENLPKRVGT